MQGSQCLPLAAADITKARASHHQAFLPRRGPGPAPGRTRPAPLRPAAPSKHLISFPRSAVTKKLSTLPPPSTNHSILQFDVCQMEERERAQLN